MHAAARNGMPCGVRTFLAFLSLCVVLLCGGGTTAESAAKPENRLAQASSPYLRQHIDNPVDWYPWGEEALARAAAENKLIFLSIGYSTCYWCHVMEREVFEDQATAELMNANFVSVLVDREERPDIDSIYMRYRQLRGDPGGWPLSALLTPDLKPVFAAGTLFNPQFSELLRRARDQWATNQAALQSHADNAARALERAAQLAGQGASYGLPSRELLEAAAQSFAGAFDRLHGGIGRGAKFPQPTVLEMLLAAHEANGDAAALEMVLETLAAMDRGALQDHLGGGFHRYTTDRAWRVPHFEKMLYDNAQLLHSYARAYALTGQEDLLRVVESTVAYLDQDMTDPSGLFYAAEDSETHEIEGAFYLWQDAELDRLFSESERALFSAAFGVAPIPGESHGGALYRKAADQAPKAATLDDLKAKLLAAREARERPFRDDKILAAWNGLTIEALAYAGRVIGREDFINRAERAASSLQEVLLTSDGDLLHQSVEGEASIEAYLEDYGAVILALAELYRATGNGLWLEQASGLADRMVARLQDREGGAFFDVAADRDDLIVVPKRTQDGALPAGNSLAVRALVGLASLGREAYDIEARRALSSFAPTLEETPTALPYMLWALDELYRHDEAKVAKRGQPRRSSEVVRLSASWREAADSKQLVASLQLDEGWHVNANIPSMEALIPTSLTLALAGQDLASKIVYPESQTLDTPIGPLSIYKDSAEIRTNLADALPQDHGAERLELQLTMQACNDSGTCLPPETLSLSLAL